MTGILRHEMMDFMFADPLMLDDLDYLFKCDVARKLMFYHQSKYQPPPPVDKSNVSFFLFSTLITNKERTSCR